MRQFERTLACPCMNRRFPACPECIEYGIKMGIKCAVEFPGPVVEVPGFPDFRGFTVSLVQREPAYGVLYQQPAGETIDLEHIEPVTLCLDQVLVLRTIPTGATESPCGKSDLAELTVLNCITCHLDRACEAMVEVDCEEQIAA